MSEPFAEKVAIVTGAGRGLGRAMALGLARAGARVIALAARERGEIEAVARESQNIVPLLADVSREEDCARAVAEAKTRFGRLDVLVNNAGRGMKYVSTSFMTEPTRFWEVEPATWRLVIDTNVNGPFLMARAAAPLMRAADARRGLGPHHQRVDFERDDAATAVSTSEMRTRACCAPRLRAPAHHIASMLSMRDP